MKTIAMYPVILVGGALLSVLYAAAPGRPAEQTACGWVGGPEEHRRCEELEAQIFINLHRYEVKMATTRALLAGEIGLREAARRFRAVTAGYPEAEANLRQVRPDVSATELYCRNVLDFVGAEVMDLSRDEAASIQNALQDELARILQAETDVSCSADDVD